MRSILFILITSLIYQTGIGQSNKIDQFRSIKGVAPGQEFQGIKVKPLEFIPVQWNYPSQYPLIWDIELKLENPTFILGTIPVEHVLIEKWKSKVKSVAAVLPYNRFIKENLEAQLGKPNGPYAYFSDAPDMYHAYGYYTWQGRQKQVILIEYRYTGLSSNRNTLDDQHCILILQDMDVEDAFLSWKRDKDRYRGNLIDDIR